MKSLMLEMAKVSPVFNISLFMASLFGVVVIAIIIMIIVFKIKEHKKQQVQKNNDLNKIDDAIKEKTATITCEYCGSVNKIENSICANCGAPIKIKK